MSEDAARATPHLSSVRSFFQEPVYAPAHRARAAHLLPRRTADGPTTNHPLLPNRARLSLQVMYLALGSVHPTTLAVGNTMKRVFIVVTGLVVFKTPISRLGVLGSAIAVGGVLVYSLTKQHYDVLDRKMKD